MMEEPIIIKEEKPSIQRIIMDVTEKDVDIISTSSEEYIQNQITNNDENTSPERRRIYVTENRDTFSILTINHRMKNETEEATREELSENDENNEVNDDLSFSKVQSDNTWEMDLLEEPQHAKEKEKQVKKQKLKSKQRTKILKETNSSSANSEVMELLSKSKNDSEQLEIITETLGNINKLFNYKNNSENKVTCQFNPNTIQFDKFNINPIIVNKIGEISRELPQITIDNINDTNNVNSNRTEADRLCSSDEIVHSPINMDITTYLGLTNSLQTVRNNVQHKQKVERKRKHQSREQQVTASSSETSTSLSDITQLEIDEEILLREIENELKYKQEILLRKQRIEIMREMVCNLKKENACRKVGDEQARQARITTAINTYRQLKNQGNSYEDNFVIKNRAGSETCRFNVKFTIEDLRPKSYKRPRVHRIIYDFEEGQLKRTISLGAESETNQQIVPQYLQEIQPSTSKDKTGTKRRSARIKRSSIFSFTEEIEQKTTSLEKNRRQITLNRLRESNDRFLKANKDTQKKTLFREKCRQIAVSRLRESNGRFVKTNKDTPKTAKQSNVKPSNVKPSNIFKSRRSVK